MTKRQTILILIAALMPLLFMHLYHFNWEGWEKKTYLGGDGDGYSAASGASCISIMIALVAIAFHKKEQPS